MRTFTLLFQLAAMLVLLLAPSFTSAHVPMAIAEDAELEEREEGLTWADVDIDIDETGIEDLHVIEFNTTSRKVLAKEEVEELIRQGVSFVDVTQHEDLRATAAPATPRIPSSPSRQSLVNSFLPQLSTRNIEATISRLSSYYTRYYTTSSGESAARYLYERFRTYARAHSEGRAEVEFFRHSWRQPSVIARIRGSGSAANEVVIVGAHEDSVSSPRTSRAPGADDDASGIATILELFRILTSENYTPERTLEFHCYAAEEAGLRGSQAIAASYQSRRVVVAGMMQLDMTSYRRSGTTPSIALVQDNVHSGLTYFVKQLVRSYARIPYTTTTCGYGCSDHASWTRAGYAAVFPFESSMSRLNPNIHSSRDTLARLDLDHGLEFARLAMGFLVELSFDN